MRRVEKSFLAQNTTVRPQCLPDARQQCMWWSLQLLRAVAPWRFIWASADLANLRRYCPSKEVLPLPTCIIPDLTIVSPWLVPATHLLLAVLDLLMLPLVLYEWLMKAATVPQYGSPLRDSQDMSWHFVRPLLTSQRKVPEAPPRGLRAAAQLLVQTLLDGLLGSCRSTALVTICFLYCGLLCLGYTCMYLLGAWRLAVAIGGLLGYRRALLVHLLVCFLKNPTCQVLAVKCDSKLRSFWRRPASDNSTIRAFHGTGQEAADRIVQSGFRASTTGMLGRGVYVSRDLNKVLGYGGHDGVVLELRVSVGKVCLVDHQLHSKQHAWRVEADTAWVPYRCGMVPSGLEEACVANPGSITVVRTWPKSSLLQLLLYDWACRLLDFLSLAWCWAVVVQAVQPLWEKEQKPSALPPLLPLRMADIEMAAPPNKWTRDWCHATVPPALAHSVKVK
ncbi:unnamed protein product [Effrenium voratum]|uniref:PARP catalytic domain-containing protein n=1 Tax=Effrenium voratum TaxID=2562239 RepID=A0AA36MZE0_9DINO|nr:unnamed protein product [Effrenium voratum]CAJ1416494.1 unnamed protein product [Effrenium voratum]